jgi:hypothetical protein
MFSRPTGVKAFRRQSFRGEDGAGDPGDRRLSKPVSGRGLCAEAHEPVKNPGGCVSATYHP